MTRFALLGSPFLGPEVWLPTAACLRRLGHSADVLSPCGDTPHEIHASLLAHLPDAPVVLVPHSNAGLYVAGLAAHASVTAVVFVDALLPGPAGRTPVSSPDLVEHLASLATSDGLLVVWSRWWSEESLAALLPDPAVRARIESGQRRLPLGYLTDTVETPPGWETLPLAYLAFGDGYADELDRARSAGWRTQVLGGGHLHQAVDPGAVAEAIVNLGAAGRQS